MNQRKSDAEVFWPDMATKAPSGSTSGVKPPAKTTASKTTAFWSTGQKKTEDVFYPDHFERSLEMKFRDNLPRLRDHLGLTAEQEAALRKQHVAWLKDMAGGNSVKAEKLHDLLTQYLITPATDEAMDQWRPETHRQIREKYNADSDRLMGKAKELIRSRPDLVKALNDTGLANHPDIWLETVETVRQAERREALEKIQQSRDEKARE